MTLTDGVRPGSRVGVWWVALRPFAFSATALPVVLGATMAWEAGFPWRWSRFVLALLGIVCFNAAANLLNDCFDFRRGLDVGVHPGSGAIVRGWLSDREVHRAAWLFLAAGIACGLVLTGLAGMPVLWLGIAGTVLALGYTRSGFCLKYAGLGDVTILVACGVLPVSGAYWVQAESFAWSPVLWSVPQVLLTVGILHANNWRDIASDTERSCRTVASLIGASASMAYYRLLVLLPFALAVGYFALGRLDSAPVRAPAAVLLTLLALPMAVRLACVNWPARPVEFAKLDARTAQTHMTFDVLLVVGFAVSGLLARIAATRG